MCEAMGKERLDGLIGQAGAGEVGVVERQRQSRDPRASSSQRRGRIGNERADVGLDAERDAARRACSTRQASSSAALDSESSRLSSSKWTPGRIVTWQQSQAAA